MGKEEKATRHLACDLRVAAGTCTALALLCLPALKWWTTGGWRRQVVAAIALLTATLASALYRCMTRGSLWRCLGFSVASALGGIVVWALFCLLPKL